MRRQRRLWKLAGERATCGGVLGLLGWSLVPDDARAFKTSRGKTGFGIAWWRSRFSFIMLAWFLWMLHVRSVMERHAIFLSCSPGARLSRTLARAKRCRVISLSFSAMSPIRDGKGSALVSVVPWRLKPGLKGPVTG